MSEDPRDQELQVVIEDGRLIMSIGINLLTSAAIECDALDHGDFEITDADVFAAEIARKLEDEEEDGTTLIHHAFDRAAELAIESGCDGVRGAGDGDDD